jgi:hypothetical protein
VTCKNAIFAIFEIGHQDLIASSPAVATHHTMSDSESSVGGATHSRAGPAKTPAGATPVPAAKPTDGNYFWPIPNNEALYNKLI